MSSLTGTSTTPAGPGAATSPARAPRRAATTTSDHASRRMPRWLRGLHVYTSMISMVVVLAFALTGLTLNHPQWTFGSAASTTEVTGTLPFSPTSAGSVNELAVSEYLRANALVAGTITEHRVDGSQGSLTYKQTGYQATVLYDTGTGTYTVTRVQQGWISVLNDLHKGRDAGPGWKLVIDLSAGFLALVALSGLFLQVYLRRRRLAALSAAAAGGVAVVVLTYLTIRS